MSSEVSTIHGNRISVRSVGKDQPSALPEFCEVPDCKTLYVGRDAKGNDHHARGKADVFVNEGSRKRGICAEHYERHLIRIGKASNQDLMGRDDRLDPAVVHAFREKFNEA